MLEGRFAGVGLKNVLLIALMTMLFIVMAKVIFNKYPTRGVTEMVNTI